MACGIKSVCMKSNIFVWLLSVALGLLAPVSARAATLFVYDSTGAHFLGTGVQSAGIAFGPSGEVLDIVDTAGTLRQFDSSGTHVLGGGIQSADVAFGPQGQVLAIVFSSGELFQFDAFGG